MEVAARFTSNVGTTHRTPRETMGNASISAKLNFMPRARKSIASQLALSPAIRLIFMLESGFISPLTRL